MFKRARPKHKNKIIAAIWHYINLPFDFIRHYTVPMVENEEWSKSRAIAMPLTVPFSFMFLFG